MRLDADLLQPILEFFRPDSVVTCRVTSYPSSDSRSCRTQTRCATRGAWERVGVSPRYLFAKKNPPGGRGSHFGRPGVGGGGRPKGLVAARRRRVQHEYSSTVPPAIYGNASQKSNAEGATEACPRPAPAGYTPLKLYHPCTIARVRAISAVSVPGARKSAAGQKSSSRVVIAFAGKCGGAHLLSFR